MQGNITSSLNSAEKQRNYGIDFLRLIAMFYVVIIHLLGHGGIQANITERSSHFAAWTLFICVYSTVDIYVIISGYVGYRNGAQRIRYGRYVKLWLQVVFYGILAVLITKFFGTQPVTPGMILECFIPLTANQYWFFTKYSMLFLAMPVINRFAADCTERELTMVTAVSAGIYSCYATFVFPKYETFDLNGGYSLLWFLVLYLVGVWLKKCDIPGKISKRKALVLLVVTTLIPVFLKTEGAYISTKIWGHSIAEDFFLLYISPTTLIIAVLYVIIFSQIHLHGILKRFTMIFAPSAFAVYLLHDNGLIREQFILEKFAFVAGYSAGKIVCMTIGFAAVIMVLGLCIDVVRKWTFGSVEKKIEGFIQDKLDRMAGY